MIGIGRIVVVCLAASGVSTLSQEMAFADPSFDCSRASTLDEKAICEDGLLSRLDSLIAKAFRTYEPEFQTKKSVSRRALADRRACEDDKVCIAAAQLSSLQAFGGDATWVEEFVVSQLKERATDLSRTSPRYSSKMPSVLGQCVWTHIKELSTRFGEPLSNQNEDEGTSVVYENGGYGVTYGRDYAFYNAKEGQPVVLCWVSKMYDCPKGDERGSEYYTLDTATGESWVLPDAQHMCGGA